ncbi:MAG: DNA-directed RNA polymerase subunit omega [Syntrophomonas sp.]|uniref:DNA-directed RNA polymerase subunit omega n=1 Tax=Syntrophomonas sp. TaxID=2053627 RepID=UPI002635B011|nr:DNA-directed RNA polymerase subunit omega [Syntrophomonas sp.]MDD2509722.1 DNA-directed RNA polymerase subunit omega [Syntrophomonas sp.]MDD3879153.1 DNA-directed RNA polymerase subunit omega [Syntrophomonas sp.]MDD4625854.1 DNA-directed RNA polymerase subunit omega [Syntrophomonas sp.]
MIPSSTRELLNIANSKYAVVVAVAKRARSLSAKCKNDENYRLSTMVTRALDDVVNGRVIIVPSKNDGSKEV